MHDCVREVLRLNPTANSCVFIMKAAVIMPALSRDYNCDSTTIRLRCDDTTTHSTTTEVIEITIRLRYDYDPTTTYRARLFPFDAIRREEKINMSIFRRSLVVVVSQSNRNFDHFRRSRMRRGIVAS